jgi:hypothetical protein
VLQRRDGAGDHEEAHQLLAEAGATAATLSLTRVARRVETLQGQPAAGNAVGMMPRA